MSVFYYIIPAVEITQRTEYDEYIVTGIAPAVIPAGKWVGDSKDKVSYLVKTDTPVSGLEPVEPNSAEVIALGFDPAFLEQWNGGW